MTTDKPPIAVVPVPPPQAVVPEGDEPNAALLSAVPILHHVPLRRLNPEHSRPTPAPLSAFGSALS